MANIQKEVHGRSALAPQPENVLNVNQTAYSYGEDAAVLALPPTKHAAALRGQYYLISNPTPQTGIAMVTSLTALTEASPLLIIENPPAQGGQITPSILLDYFTLIVSTGSAAATNWAYAWKIDYLPGKRGTTAGSSITPQNMNSNFPNASRAQVSFGALVVNAAQQSSQQARLGPHGFAALPATIAQLAGDVYDFHFGAIEGGATVAGQNAATKTIASRQVLNHGPLVIAPGSTATLFMWGTANATAVAFEFEGGWIEY